MSYSSRAFALVVALSVLAGCSKPCHEATSYTCAELEDVVYNVYYSEEGASEEVWIGRSRGLQNCGSDAHRYAAGRGKKADDSWSYICCLRTEKSECAEKHR